MEVVTTPNGVAKHSPSRKASSPSSSKDLWYIAREGSLSELESALLLLKKHGGNIDSRNACGLTPLHIATWRNNVPIVKRLLDAGADPDARDGESGWSSLHRALHFGHLAVASVLIQFGASLIIEDSKHRTPVDLLSGPVVHATGTSSASVVTDVFSWGSGTNYQLGTGNAHIQKLPCKVDALQGCDAKLIAAAKFHSVAVGTGGELYTWGYGRGGRLGHPDFDIHSGQAAVITPRRVIVGLGSRRVKDVAVAKHHTVIATENGEVFTWGSNREGQLGYTSVDTQATPRRISSLKSKIISVAAANKHSAAVSECGEIFTWGCNKEGQLGYGTSNSASNYSPRVVEYLKGKVFTAISAAKCHTLVLSNEGEVFTWGHRLVTPRRVIIARNVKKGGHSSIKFHRMEKLRVVSIAAGVIHSTALTDDGALFYWASADPSLRCQQLYSMCGKNIVSISSGKYWTAAVNDLGDVYMWDGKKQKDEAPIPTRLHGVKRAISVAVGETHLLVISSLYHPSHPLKTEVRSNEPISCVDELDELDEDLLFNDIEPIKKLRKAETNAVGENGVPSLKSLCEKTAIECLVEPRNAIQLLEIADSLEADELRVYCEEIAIRNLDFIFTVSVPAVASVSLEVLAKLEKSLDMKSSEPWSHRQLPTPTATFPAVISVEDGLDNKGYQRLRDNNAEPMLKSYEGSRVDTFFHTDNGSESAEFLVSKQVRALKKKLQQIEILELKLSNGHPLDDQQLMKLQSKVTVVNALVELGLPLNTLSSLSDAITSDAKTNHSGASRKQTKKKQNENHTGTMLPENEICAGKAPIDVLSDMNGLQISHLKDDAQTSRDDESGGSNDHVSHSPKVTPQKSSDSDRTPKGNLSKKKKKKGGLSMFLSGALDDQPRDILPPPPPPPMPKKEGPAWGGVKVSKESASLRDIQCEQSRTRKIQPVHIQKDCSDNLAVPQSSNHIPIGNILSGLARSPIAAGRTQASPASVGEKHTPPWSSGGTPPRLSKASLRDIQMQQVKHSLSQSPKTSTTGFNITSSQVTALDTICCPKDAIPNRWFKPETEMPPSLRSIQIEEKAMQELKRIYNNVRLVKAQAHGPS